MKLYAVKLVELDERGKRIEHLEVNSVLSEREMKDPGVIDTLLLFMGSAALPQDRMMLAKDAQHLVAPAPQPAMVRVGDHTPEKHTCHGKGTRCKICFAPLPGRREAQPGDREPWDTSERVVTINEDAHGG